MNLKQIFACTLLLATFTSKAQLYIDNAQLTIQSGASVVVQGDVTSNSNILGDGKLVLKGTTSQNVSMNGNTIPNLEVDNTSNVNLTSNTQIGSNLTFTNGKINAGNFDVKFSSTATVTGATDSKYIVTGGTGKVTKAGLSTTAFTYPVGFNSSSYNPLTISNSGTSDDISVRCLDSAYLSGTSGTSLSADVVNTSWDLTESVAGGSNLSITANWAATDELSGFNRTKGAISNYITAPAANIGWDALNTNLASATGTGPYSTTRSGITSVGAFAVGTKQILSPLLVSPKVFLQGNYSSGTGLMSDALRSANLIPLNEPYGTQTGIAGTTNPFSHSGSGGGEKSTASVVGSAAGSSSNNTIVDWVFVQLQSTSGGPVVSTRAALLQRDGDIVDVDGVSPLNMAGNAPGNYFVSVRHRNHLGVRSASSISLSKTTTTNYDFTTALTQAVANSGNNAMAPVGTKFCMWGGNANSNTNVRYSGISNDEVQLLNTCLGGNKSAILSNQYSSCDLNLNGNVRYSGINNDEVILLNTVLGGNKSKIISQATF